MCFENGVKKFSTKKKRRLQLLIVALVDTDAQRGSFALQETRHEQFLGKNGNAKPSGFRRILYVSLHISEKPVLNLLRACSVTA